MDHATSLVAVHVPTAVVPSATLTLATPGLLPVAPGFTMASGEHWLHACPRLAADGASQQRASHRPCQSENRRERAEGVSLPRV